MFQFKYPYNNNDIQFISDNFKGKLLYDKNLKELQKQIKNTDIFSIFQRSFFFHTDS